MLIHRTLKCCIYNKFTFIISWCRQQSIALMNCIYKAMVFQDVPCEASSPKSVHDDVDINGSNTNTIMERPCVAWQPCMTPAPCMERPCVAWQPSSNDVYHVHRSQPHHRQVKPTIDGKVLYTTNTGGILRTNDTIIKWFDVSSRSANAIDDIISGHMVASTQRDKKGCVHVGPLLEGIYQGNPVMFYTMPCAKMDLLDWLDDHDDVSDAEWAKNFASVLSIFVAVATHLYEMHGQACHPHRHQARKHCLDGRYSTDATPSTTGGCCYHH